jgi:hypothetical protein
MPYEAPVILINRDTRLYLLVLLPSLRRAFFFFFCFFFLNYGRTADSVVSQLGLNFEGINFCVKTRTSRQVEEMENLSNTFFSFIVWTEIYGEKTLERKSGLPFSQQI